MSTGVAKEGMNLILSANLQIRIWKITKLRFG